MIDAFDSYPADRAGDVWIGLGESDGVSLRLTVIDVGLGWSEDPALRERRGGKLILELASFIGGHA